MLSTIPVITMIAWALATVFMVAGLSVGLTAVFGEGGRVERFLSRLSPEARRLIASIRN